MLVEVHVLSRLMENPFLEPCSRVADKRHPDEFVRRMIREVREVVQRLSLEIHAGNTCLSCLTLFPTDPISLDFISFCIYNESYSRQYSNHD